DVREPQRASFAVERESPRIAQAPGEDLRAVEARRVVRGTERISGERVAGRPVGNRIRARAVDVDAQQRAEQIRRVLRTSARIAGAAAVTEPEIEIAVGAERDMTAVVVRERLIYANHVLSAARVECRTAVAAREAGDDGDHRRAFGE